MVDVFISYSHGKDSPVAESLGKGLKQFAAPFHKLRPALRVFRDQTDLSVSPSLWDAIEAQLRKSRYLVLIASTRSAASPWVEREVTTFLAEHDPGKLIIVLTAGGILWDNAAGDFDWNATTALSKKAFSGVFADEPLFVDLSWARDTPEGLSLDNVRFADTIATIASPVHGRPKAELYGEQARQRRRSLLLGWSISGVLLVLVIAIGLFAAYAVYQSELAASRERAALSSVQLNNSALKSAVLALEAWNIRPVREAEDAVRQAVLAPFPRLTVDSSASVAISCDDSYALVLREDFEAELIELANGDVLSHFKMPKLDFAIGDTVRDGCGGLRADAEKQRCFDFSPALGLLAVANADQPPRFVDTRSGRLLGPSARLGNGEASGDARVIEDFVVRRVRDRGYLVFDAETGFEIFDLKYSSARSVMRGDLIARLQGQLDTAVLSLVASQDGSRLLAGREDGVASVHDRTTLEMQRIFVGDGGRVCGGDFSPGDSLAVTSSLSGRSFVWHVPSGQRIAALNAVDGKVLDSYFSPRGHYVITHHAGDEGSKWIHVWPANWQAVHTAKHPRKSAYQDARFASDGVTLLLTDGSDYYRWVPGRRPVNTDLAKEWSRLDPPSPVGNANCPGATQASPDGKLFGSMQRYSISLCDGETGRTVQKIRAEDSSFVSFSFSPDGQFILAAVQSGKGSRDPLHYAGVWHIRNGALWLRLIGHTDWLISASFNRDGSKVVTTADDQTVRVYETPALRPVEEIIQSFTRRFLEKQR